MRQRVFHGFSGAPSFGLLLAVFVFFNACGSQTSEDLQGQAAPIPVEVAEVQQRSITEYISATGRIAPNVQVQLATRLQGRVLEVNAEEGQRVAQNQVLVRIDSSEILAKRSQALAARSQAQATLKQLDASEREAQAVLTNAQTNLKRVRQLLDRKATTQEAFDKAVAEAEVAQARLDAIIAQRSVVRANISMAEAQIEEASAMLSYATLVAPVGGVVTSRRVEVGDLSTPGVSLLVLEDLSGVKVELTVSETDVAYVSAGTNVQVRVDALPGRVFEGVVETLIPSGDPLSHAFIAKVILDNPQGELKPGMFARAWMLKAHRENTLTVPLDALLEETDAKYVYKVEDSRALRVAVRTGLQDLTSAEVLEGLAAGERVVTRGKENLTHQSRVRVINPRSESQQ